MLSVRICSASSLCLIERPTSPHNFHRSLAAACAGSLIVRHADNSSSNRCTAPAAWHTDRYEKHFWTSSLGTASQRGTHDQRHTTNSSIPENWIFPVPSLPGEEVSKRARKLSALSGSGARRSSDRGSDRGGELFPARRALFPGHGRERELRTTSPLISPDGQRSHPFPSAL